MKSWNFIKFDQISGRVTSEVGIHTPARAPRIKATNRGLVPMVILSTVLLAAGPNSQIQPAVSGTSPNVNLSVETVTTSAPAKPPFAMELNRFLVQKFVSANSDALRSISHVGASLDKEDRSSNVALALSDSEDNEVWTSCA